MLPCRARTNNQQQIQTGWRPTKEHLSKYDLLNMFDLYCKKRKKRLTEHNSVNTSTKLMCNAIPIALYDPLGTHSIVH